MVDILFSSGTSFLFSSLYPMGGLPLVHIPLLAEAAFLSRILSPVTSLSNCANDHSVFIYGVCKYCMPPLSTETYIEEIV